MGLLKVVLDVNVIVSAVFGGNPEQALYKAIAHRLLISDPIEAEMSAVTDDLRGELSRDELRVLRQLARRVVSLAHRVKIPGQLHICRDPTDDVYLETCLVGRAHYLVTGDRDLLEIERGLLNEHGLGRLEIVAPATFVAEA